MAASVYYYEKYVRELYTLLRILFLPAIFEFVYAIYYVATTEYLNVNQWVLSFGMFIMSFGVIVVYLSMRSEKKGN